MLFGRCKSAVRNAVVNHGGTNPVTADVTALYVTNAGTVDSKFKLRVLIT
jgi:hypothetical protein